MDLLTCLSTVLLSVYSTVRVYRYGPVKVFVWSVSPFLAQNILDGIIVYFNERWIFTNQRHLQRKNKKKKNQNFYIGIMIKHHWSAFRRIFISHLMLNCRCYGCHWRSSFAFSIFCEVVVWNLPFWGNISAI